MAKAGDYTVTILASDLFSQLTFTLEFTLSLVTSAAESMNLSAPAKAQTYMVGAPMLYVVPPSYSFLPSDVRT